MAWLPLALSGKSSLESFSYLLLAMQLVCHLNDEVLAQLLNSFENIGHVTAVTGSFEDKLTLSLSVAISSSLVGSIHVSNQ